MGYERIVSGWLVAQRTCDRLRYLDESLHALVDLTFFCAKRKQSRLNVTSSK